MSSIGFALSDQTCSLFRASLESVPTGLGHSVYGMVKFGEVLKENPVTAYVGEKFTDLNKWLENKTGFSLIGAGQLGLMSRNQIPVAVALIGAAGYQAYYAVQAAYENPLNAAQMGFGRAAVYTQVALEQIWETAKALPYNVLMTIAATPRFVASVIYGGAKFVVTSKIAWAIASYIGAYETYKSACSGYEERLVSSGQPAISFTKTFEKNGFDRLYEEQQLKNDIRKLEEKVEAMPTESLKAMELKVQEFVAREKNKEIKIIQEKLIDNDLDIIRYKEKKAIANSMRDKILNERDGRLIDALEFEIKTLDLNIRKKINGNRGLLVEFFSKPEFDTEYLNYLELEVCKKDIKNNSNLDSLEGKSYGLRILEMMFNRIIKQIL